MSPARNESDDDDWARVRGATSVLVLAPEMGESVDRVCHRLLEPDHPAETGVIKISYHFSPAEIADRWLDRNPDSEADMYCLSVSATRDEVKKSYGDNISFHNARAGDLTGTGMKINEIVGEIRETRSELIICLDSLDSMLMYNDQPMVYRFIRTITNYLSANNAQIHLHLDPSQHDDAVNTLRSAFNAIVEVGDDGIVNIKTR